MITLIATIQATPTLQYRLVAIGGKYYLYQRIAESGVPLVVRNLTGHWDQSEETPRAIKAACLPYKHMKGSRRGIEYVAKREGKTIHWQPGFEPKETGGRCHKSRKVAPATI